MNAQHSTPRADHHVEPHSDRDRHHPQHLDPQARPGRRWLRILLPALLILAWLAVTGIGGPYFGKISEVTSESATDRLPASAQSTEVAQRLADFKESDAIPAIVVLENPDGITEQDTAWAQQLAKDPGREVPLDGAASPAIPSEDGKALQIVLPLDSGAQPDDAVTALRERLNEAPEGLRGWVTGPAGFTADLAEAFSGIDGILLAVALAVVFGVAPHILRMAYQAARRGILNQHVLLEVGAFAGIAGGIIGLTGVLPDYPTAPFFAVTVLVTNYHIFSEWLSLLVKTRSSQAVRKLLELQPDTARLVRDGREEEVPVAEISVGDTVRVRPGDRVPVDGQVIDGHTTVDLSLVTGEPVPTERSTGDELIGGSINGAGSVLVEVTRTGADSFLAQVVRHVEDARALKPGILHLVDRVLRVYTPTVLIVAALALLGWLAGSWVLTGEPDVRRAVFAGIGVLVMGYPCAVGIAAPLAIVRAAGEAADKGIIMRTGEAFQTFGQVRTIVLDKTGTLTEGRPTVRETEAMGNEAELLAIAAAAENPSEHPLARAIVTAAEQRGLTVKPVDDFDSITGFGVSASIEGDPVLVGRPAFLRDQGIDLSPLSSAVTRLEGIGRTVVAVAVAGRLQGVIALGDDIRPDAVQAVTAMREAGIRPVLATGDNGRAAAHVAAEVGIEDIRAGILPEEKAALVRELQDGGNRVAMVGDGINDAPALMQADVGIAMGGGTDIAVESADVVIVRDDLTAILEAQQTSRASYRRTRQNVSLAFLFNGIGIPAATTGLVYPVWAMVAMALSVTTIFVNSLGGRPSLLFEAIGSVGRTSPNAEENERQK